MSAIVKEPSIAVGLATLPMATVTLHGVFYTLDGLPLEDGMYQALIEAGSIVLKNTSGASVRNSGAELKLIPVDIEASRFTLEDIMIGVDFHWQRKESQTFQGSLRLRATEAGLLLINELPVEAYLTSVISSEMSASCPPDLLRAHAVVSRSWLLAQLRDRTQASVPLGVVQVDLESGEIDRWYTRENHQNFDVCGDDHCQRYHGIARASAGAVFDAVRETRGAVLMAGDEICDARYSKSCGGVTELYAAAWGDKAVPYLQSIYDGPDGSGLPAGFTGPLSVEENAVRWIDSHPPAYCNTASRELLARILPGFDQETPDFYRWRVAYSRQELGQLINRRLGMDPGPVLGLEPLARGLSSRITRLKIIGQERTLIIGRELEIRRALSSSHLYSSAFTIESDPASEKITLLGAGWGHGVGLCQIGAAVMADTGIAHTAILPHYFPGTALTKMY